MSRPSGQKRTRTETETEQQDEREHKTNTQLQKEGEENEEEDESDYSSDEEQTEYVIVSLPASLVHQLRSSGTSIDICGLDTSEPYFVAPYSSPLHAVRGTIDEKGLSSSSTVTLAPPEETKFVGTYEHSVGTNLLWAVHPNGPSHDFKSLPSSAAPLKPSSTSSASSSASLMVPTRPSTALSPPLAPLRTPSPRLIPLHSASPPTVTMPAANMNSNAGLPQIEFEGKTWKRLVFGRQR